MLPFVFMYSGQGSQYFQMGRKLYENNITFKDSMIKANNLYKDMTGFSIIDQIYNDQTSISQPFTHTIFTHPAIFIVEYALTQALKERNIFPSMVLGASMGEFAAAVTADILSLETALYIISKQTLALEKCSSGGMLAIIHDPTLYQATWIKNNCELAAVNFSTHFVVSGTTEHLLEITKKLQEQNIAFQMLPVSQAFHSSLMEDARTDFLQVIETIKINPPAIPFFSCTTASVLKSILMSHFWDIVRSPILFQKSIQILEEKHPAIYIDIGPSGTLATFVKYNISSASLSKSFQIMTPYSNDINKLDQCVADLANVS